MAIETSCRRGGVALGRGEELIAAAHFSAAARHGTQLVSRLGELLAEAGLGPRDVREVYVSVGPGSFTGTRIGVTVARMLALAVPTVRCVAVSSPLAVAEGARGLPWRNLAVVLDAREGLIHATRFTRRGETIFPAGPGEVMSPEEFLYHSPRPLLLLGEALGHHDLSAEAVTIPQPEATDAPPHLPVVESVWRVGRRRGRKGEFTEPARLLPVYARKPQALRVWEQKHGIDGETPGDDNGIRGEPDRPETS